MDASLSRVFHGGVKIGHLRPQDRECVQEGHHGSLRERAHRQEDRGGPRRTVRRAAWLQASDHRRERQRRISDADRPARAATEAPPPERRRRLPSRPTRDAQEEDGPRKHGVARHPSVEPEDRRAWTEVDRGRVAGAGAMKVPGQPEVNIGVVGHVDHGKSTLTERLTGERTDRHSEEIKRGISIRLGYADMAIYKCPKDTEPAAYQNTEICKPHNEGKPAKMYVARSFDVNQPGIPPEKIVGGVLGGSLMLGRMKVGEEIEISPGRQVTLGNKTEWKNITTTIRSLHTGGSARKEVRPGGLIAIGTNLDPVLTKADGLVGRVVGPPASRPEILMKMTVEVKLLERVVGGPEEIEGEGSKASEAVMVYGRTATRRGGLHRCPQPMTPKNPSKTTPTAPTPTATPPTFGMSLSATAPHRDPPMKM